METQIAVLLRGRVLKESDTRKLRSPGFAMKTRWLALERRVPNAFTAGGAVIVYVLFFAVAVLVAVSAASSLVGNRRRKF